MNSTAVIFCIFLALVGYLINASQGALIGLAIGLGLTVLAEMCDVRLLRSLRQRRKERHEQH